VGNDVTNAIIFISVTITSLRAYSALPELHDVQISITFGTTSKHLRITSASLCAYNALPELHDLHNLHHLQHNLCHLRHNLLDASTSLHLQRATRVLYLHTSTSLHLHASSALYLHVFTPAAHLQSSIRLYLHIYTPTARFRSSMIYTTSITFGTISKHLQNNLRVLFLGPVTTDDESRRTLVPMRSSTWCCVVSLGPATVSRSPRKPLFPLNQTSWVRARNPQETRPAREVWTKNPEPGTRAMISRVGSPATVAMDHYPKRLTDVGRPPEGLTIGRDDTTAIDRDDTTAIDRDDTPATDQSADQPRWP